MKTLLGTLLGLALLAGLAGAVSVYRGGFDIAADTPHSEPVTRLLSFARERAIARQARDIQVPPLDDPDLIARGAGEYAEMCAGCHLAPGMADNELRPGLYPQPPNLAEPGAPPSAADARQYAAHVFWVIKHGIKMSAMPAWGLTHDDDTIWSIVAFLQKLPQLKPDEYAAMTADSESVHEAAGHGDAAHVHDEDQPDTAQAGDEPAKTEDAPLPDPAAHHHHHH